MLTEGFKRRPVRASRARPLVLVTRTLPLPGHWALWEAHTFLRSKRQCGDSETAEGAGFSSRHLSLFTFCCWRDLSKDESYNIKQLKKKVLCG